DAMKRAVIKRGGIAPGEDLSGLDSIFVRQCMDLLSETVITSRIPPGELYSVAFHKYLTNRYTQLAEAFPYEPRVLTYPEHPEPKLAATLIRAYIDLWLKLLDNEAKRRKRDGWEAQRVFVRALIESGRQIWG